MTITKHQHACVRIEYGDAVVVLDPGAFSEPDCAEGATAVLITHEHADHWEADRLRRTDAPIYTIEAVAAQIRDQEPDVGERISVVRPGDSFEAGLPVSVVGEKHAVIHPDLPHFDNSGFLLDVDGTAVFHPGDALTVPEQRVDLLLLPVSAPWLKISECIDYARAVGAPRAVGIHDMIYSDLALQLIQGHLERLVPDTAYSAVPPGGTV